MLPVPLTNKKRTKQIFENIYKLPFLKARLKKIIADLEKTEGCLKELRKSIIVSQSSSAT